MRIERNNETPPIEPKVTQFEKGKSRLEFPKFFNRGQIWNVEIKNKDKDKQNRRMELLQCSRVCGLGLFSQKKYEAGTVVFVINVSIEDVRKLLQSKGEWCYIIIPWFPFPLKSWSGYSKLDLSCIKYKWHHFFFSLQSLLFLSTTSLKEKPNNDELVF